MVDRKPKARRQAVESLLSAVAIAIFIPAIVGFLCVFDLFRALMGWMQTGRWSSSTLWNGILNLWPGSARPALSWVIPNNALNSVMDAPLWFMGPLLALIYVGLAAYSMSAAARLVKWVQEERATKKGSAAPPMTLRAKLVLWSLLAWLLIAPLFLERMMPHPSYGGGFFLALGLLLCLGQFWMLAEWMKSAFKWTGRFMRNE